MVKEIAKVEYIITSSETEALLLESSLIKQHQPPYNIDLKDDKNFLYIKITTAEDFPRVFTVRKLAKDKALYFGPFASAGAVRQTLRLLRKLFPHRNFTRPPSRYHLKYLVKRYPELLGPQDKAAYRATIEQIIKFMRGHHRDIKKELEQNMKAASRRKQFEQAAVLRDKIKAIERLMEKQKVISTRRENQDIISLYRHGQLGAINRFVVRQGKLIDKQNYVLRNIRDQDDSEVLSAFIARYYPQVTDMPHDIIVPIALPQTNIMEKAFGVHITAPRRGMKQKYIKLGEENAVTFLEQQQASFERHHKKIKSALQGLQKIFGLPSLPKRIEIYDISNIQGTYAVGSMVVFTDGQPSKQWYRKFKIKSVSGANDSAMMAEVLKRRFMRLTSINNQSTARDSRSAHNWPRPDLIILDGGKGQLHTAQPMIPAGIPVAALAKREEQLYLPDKNRPLTLPVGSQTRFLIQRMRDEAHRFAISFYRQYHGRQSISSSLDKIPGIGPRTKKKLLRELGSVDDVRNASETALAALVGPAKAKTIKQHL